MDEPGAQRLRAARALRQQLESYEQAGVTHVRRAAGGKSRESTVESRARKVAASKGGDEGSESKVSAAGVGVEAARRTGQPTLPSRVAAGGGLFDQSDRAAVVPAAERPRLLCELSEAVAGCQRCRVLADTRTQTVFGVGDANARLCFIGEAPGYDEDQQGEPFVGRAGQLLNRIVAACKMRREEVYIANILKCRPPDNRTPQADEMANCREYLERQLEIIQPEFICCLGAVAGQALLGVTQPIGRLRGRFFEYRGIKVMCTYHPAYLLRNPHAKGEVWNDMKMLMAAMGKSV